VWVRVCETIVGYAYLVVSWNCFYDYNISSPLVCYPTLVVKVVFDKQYKSQHTIILMPMGETTRSGVSY
jgi:hypothetical protein